MKINNRFVFGILSILLSAAIAFIAIPTISRRTNGKTDIVRITQPIMRGAQITSADYEVVEVGEFNLPANIAKTAEDVDGRYAVADLGVGDYVLSSKLSFTPISSDVQLSSIPSGKVAISLTVKTLASGLSDKLQAGDVVRIYHYLDEAKDIPELQFVQVIAVTDDKGLNVDNAARPQEDEEKRQSATITVLASPEQARVITQLENDGVAHMALISRGNEALAAELLAEQDLVIQEIYFPPEEAEEDEVGAGDASEVDADDDAAAQPDEDAAAQDDSAASDTTE